MKMSLGLSVTDLHVNYYLRSFNILSNLLLNTRGGVEVSGEDERFGGLYPRNGIA